MAFEYNEPIVGSESEDDPGEVMLFLMRTVPEEIGWDFVKWLDRRYEHPENVIRALFDPSVTSKLKEEYLKFVSSYVEEFDYFKVMFSDIRIKWVEPEGEE